ncbi:DUF2325 domain-containing protein [Xylophilus rhododendri]|uniref:DUF2325 domain-containing protein n=1 Tax=Xylophilus rhododendri TaxID=2697032 RepID=A0A857JCA1_9BURK|nr:DUF2325 domain-containing protein [Xylophilus rhododendri]QHJ00359.1 DUF2325 domain-containing protein [Xylophilus rhododendri]
MLTPPPFKLAGTATFGGIGPQAHDGCCEPASDETAAAPSGSRLRLAELDTNFQCSVIGTCLTTAALRKLMARFIDVQDASDLDIHHEAVLLASHPGAASKALHKALDHEHAATLLRFSRVNEPQALLALWDEARRNGDIPGAYWALLTHRHADSPLRRKVFGDVHMLSHLVGAANRADIRRLVALEQANAGLRELAERQQERQLAQDMRLQELQRELDHTRQRLAAAQAAPAPAPAPADWIARAEAASAQVALQTQRREAAEQGLARALNSATQLREEAAYLRRHAATLSAELAATEAQLRELACGGAEANPATRADDRLAGRRILYVGGRPSSTPSIRALVERHGGEFRHHDGGLEDRKGLLVAQVGWAELVVFPVDCVDHDSVGSLKRLCARHGIAFWPLRSAGIGSFAAALAAAPSAESPRPDDTAHRPCPKHG